MRIFAIPKYKASEIDLEKNWLISINDPGEMPIKGAHVAFQVYDVILNNTEIEEDLKSIYGEQMFNYDHAEKIVDFFKQIENSGKDLYIHCTMGVSRSGAVATVAREYFNLDYSQFKRDNPHICPNLTIMQILREEISNQTSNSL